MVRLDILIGTKPLKSLSKGLKMFVVIERTSYKEHDRIVSEGVRCKREIHEDKDTAEAEIKTLMDLCEKNHQDPVRLSDSKIQYNYVGSVTYSEFLIAEVKLC